MLTSGSVNIDPITVYMTGNVFYCGLSVDGSFVVSHALLIDVCWEQKRLFYFWPCCQNIQLELGANSWPFLERVLLETTALANIEAEADWRWLTGLVEAHSLRTFSQALAGSEWKRHEIPLPVVEFSVVLCFIRLFVTFCTFVCHRGETELNFLMCCPFAFLGEEMPDAAHAANLCLSAVLFSQHNASFNESALKARISDVMHSQCKMMHPW